MVWHCCLFFTAFYSIATQPNLYCLKPKISLLTQIKIYLLTEMLKLLKEFFPSLWISPNNAAYRRKNYIMPKNYTIWCFTCAWAVSLIFIIKLYNLDKYFNSSSSTPIFSILVFIMELQPHSQWHKMALILPIIFFKSMKTWCFCLLQTTLAHIFFFFATVHKG